MIELYYWPMLPGRGEIPRLALEQGGVPYVDVARRDGIKAVLDFTLQGTGPAPFAPPAIRHGDLVLGQTVAVSMYVGRMCGLVPADPGAAARTQQHLLSVMDVFSEAHDTHHPVSSRLTYEQQIDAAEAAAPHFRARLPGWIEYFERSLAVGGGVWLEGELSVADLGLYALQRGLQFAFPIAMAREQTPALAAHQARVAALPNIAAYTASERCLPFNRHGIFRDYAALDG
jgi:glutathione S-transferase